MRIERRLELRRFLDEIRDLRILHFPPQERILEHLEAQRILVPRMRLRYPDAIERRWFAAGKPGWRPVGEREPDGPRWRAARALEAARQSMRLPWRDDPLVRVDPLDDPREEWRQFIQFPQRRRFTPWQDFRVRVDGREGEPRWHARTVVTYYSSWQLLLFLECHDMGTAFVGNTEGWDWMSGSIPNDWRGGGIDFDPIRTLRSFRKFERALDAVVWFSEEDAHNDGYVLRDAQGRRLIEEHELLEMDRRSTELARRCRRRFRVSYPQMVELAKFLCGRWGHWDRVGYSNHAKAYKRFLGETIGLARHLRDVPIERLIADVGRVTGHFKPTLRVIFRDWALEWREDAERILIGFSRPGAILEADFDQAEVNGLLDLVEANDLLEFYWRWKSLNERAFSGDSNRLAGMRSDLQGMALSVEHLVDAMLAGKVKHPRQQLFEKFKQLWPASTEVGKLLRSAEYRRIASERGRIDLDWHIARGSGWDPIGIASDLAISHAIRGNAHSRIDEPNQLRLERMSVILLRAVMHAFRRSRTMPGAAA